MGNLAGRSSSGIPLADPELEFDFSDRNFDHIRNLVKQVAGIHLSDVKRPLVYGRVSKRLRALELENFDAYCSYVSDTPAEVDELLNVITTNLTHFFRENHHFEFLRKTLIPEIRKRGQRLRFWSTGCSTGQEPYSLAIVMHETLSDIDSWDAKILATDIDSKCLRKAKEGVYSDEELGGMPRNRRRRWFRRHDSKGMHRVVPEVRSSIAFKKLNLMDGWPVTGPFDAIFCRNVAIYFDLPTKKNLFRKFANLLRSDGCLFIGHSESLHGVCEEFISVEKNVYRKRSGE